MIAVVRRVSGKKRELLLVLLVVVGSCVGAAVGSEEVMRDLGEERRRRGADVVLQEVSSVVS
jgi:uncharacterized membrane protein YqgA involved in biofilm formation